LVYDLTNNITIYSPTLTTDVFASINDNQGHPRRLTSDKRLNYFRLGKEAFRLAADMGSLPFGLTGVAHRGRWATLEHRAVIFEVIPVINFGF